MPYLERIPGAPLGSFVATTYVDLRTRFADPIVVE